MCCLHRSHFGVKTRVCLSIIQRTLCPKIQQMTPIISLPLIFGAKRLSATYDAALVSVVLICVQTLFIVLPVPPRRARAPSEMVASSSVYSTKSWPFSSLRRAFASEQIVFMLRSSAVLNLRKSQRYLKVRL